MTEFRKRVYAACAQIPSGKVSTYGRIAKAIGCNSSMAVGQALNQNRDTENVPCHRVVGRNGSLLGYAYGGVEQQRVILEAEGVTFKDAKGKHRLRVSTSLICDLEVIG
jgi:O-6-methylguanine DNA methyltransferase